MTTGRYNLINGDVLSVLRGLPSESAHCCVTSPPYWGLRSYLKDGDALKAQELGSEKTLDCLGWAHGQKCGVCHICRMVAVFSEVKRVLRKDATLWLNYGDCYNSSPSNQLDERDWGDGVKRRGNNQERQSRRVNGLKPKDLCMVPARVALALQSDGWYLRSEIVWAKRSPMPESVTDRPTSAHEKIFLLTRSERYFYDADAVREPHDKVRDWPTWEERKAAGAPLRRGDPGISGDVCKWAGVGGNPNGKNLRNVWTLSPEPFAEAHFATFPTIIPKRAILAGTSEQGCCRHCGAGWRRVVERSREYDHVTKDPGKSKSGPYASQTGEGAGTHDIRHGVYSRSKTTGWQPSCKCGRPDLMPATVLDPFAGSGTTLAVALSLGRRAIGIELNCEYIQLAEKRIAPYAAQELLPF